MMAPGRVQQQYSTRPARGTRNTRFTFHKVSSSSQPVFGAPPSCKTTHFLKTPFVFDTTIWLRAPPLAVLGESFISAAHF
jgi:hypothetical protein